MKTKFYHMWSKCTDKNGKDHYVTVVGKFTQTRKRQIIEEIVPIQLKPTTVVDGILTYPSNRMLCRELTLGFSICHPLDDFDEEKGVELATRRIEKEGGVGTIKTQDVTMLTEDAILAEIYVKMTHITKHIDEYISDEEYTDNDNNSE